MSKDYSKLNLEELDKAKWALEGERRELRAKLAGLSDDDKANPEKVDPISEKLLALRSEMLAIQAEQDKRVLVTTDPNAHTIGVSGIESKEAVGQIGGGSKKKK